MFCQFLALHLSEAVAEVLLRSDPALLSEVDPVICFHCSYVHTGCAALRLILKNFASVIKANITAPPSLGVDITREERWVLGSSGSYRLDKPLQEMF